MSDYVCRSCLKSDPKRITLLDEICNGDHAPMEKIRVEWSGKKKRLVEVNGSPSIRPLPQKRIKNQFILCNGTHCRGEKCPYAHSFEERDSWNEQLKQNESFKPLQQRDDGIANLKSSFTQSDEIKKSLSASSQPEEIKRSSSSVSQFEDVKTPSSSDIKRTASTEPASDVASFSCNESTSCDDISELESLSDAIGLNKSEDASNLTTNSQVLDKEVCKSYYCQLLEEDKKSIGALLKQRCNGTYGLTLIKGKPGWLNKTKERHVLFACLTGLTQPQILYVTHDMQSETAVEVQIGKHKIHADIIRHPAQCNEQDLTIGMDLKNSDMVKEVMRGGVRLPKVLFRRKEYSSKLLHNSIQHLSDDLIHRILPKIEEFVSFKASVLSDTDKKKLSQLSDHQMEAAKKIITLPSGSPPLLINGAFGTGKTHVFILVANYVLQTMEKANVLVCCQSSTSADHFLEHYLNTHIRHQDSAYIVRLFRYENKNVQKQLKKYHKTVKDFCTEGKTEGRRNMLIISTYHDVIQLHKELKEPLCFSYILMDEGAQSTEVDTIASLCVASDASRIVIAGDLHQVCPGTMANLEYLSLLERLVKRYHEIGGLALEYEIILPQATHRCHLDIVQFCSDQFYESSLQCLTGNQETEYPLRFVCTSVQGSEVTAANEADADIKATLDQIYHLHESWPTKLWGPKKLAQTCVLNYNKKELGKFQHSLKKEHSDQIKAVKLLTSANIQGQEFRVLFWRTYEPTWDDGVPLCASRSFYNPNMFTTILSRAQSQVVAIGNPFALLQMERSMIQRYGTKWRCWSPYLKACLEHNTLSFDTSLKLKDAEHEQCMQLLREHCQTLQPSTSLLDVCPDVSDNNSIPQNTSKESSITPGIKSSEQHLSRLEQDYEVIKELGKGGYGLVYHVKHNVDNKDYAVKVIKMPADKRGQDSVLREVQCLSDLSHPNILRYFSSWKEECESSSGVWWNALQELNSESYSCADRSSYGVGQEDSPNESVSSGVHSSNSRPLTDDEKNTSNDNATGSFHSVILPKSNDTDTLVTFRDEPSMNPQLGSVKKLTALFIQTELCKDTLKQWLEKTTEGVGRSRQQVMDFFDQMLKAVSYIHEKKLIHRDLKPANIFLSDNTILKVGDFGLVTGTEKKTGDSSNGGGVHDHSHTIGAGTKLYMSPEQLNHSRYDEKVDIYALGLIFFEMNCPTGSYQERDKIFDDLTQYQKFPSAYKPNEHPRECAIILHMTKDNPSARPSAHEIASGEDLKRLKKVIRRTETKNAYIKKI